MTQQLSNKTKFKSLFAVMNDISALFGGISFNQNGKFYSRAVIPLEINLETAHHFEIQAMKSGRMPKPEVKDTNFLKTILWNLHFKNPLGIAAGFDRQGEVVEQLHKIGFGFVEIGTVTPKPQPGNPKPRVFRLPEDNAIINRHSFNSDGYDVIWKRLSKLKKNKNFNGILGINLGTNEDTENFIQDYIDGIKKFMDIANYFVINVSNHSNIAGQKDLQELLTELNVKKKSIGNKQPLLLKLSPDLIDSERQNVATMILNKKTSVDGLILCSPTNTRPNLTNENKKETGELSGAPLRDMSTAIISDMYKRTHGSVPIIGVGGIFNGADAYDKIKAGASLVQILTSYFYIGPPIINQIKTELYELLKANGFSSLNDAVGKKFR